jgi:hypothetical protein
MPPPSPRRRARRRARTPRTPFDTYAKDVTRDFLKPVGRAETDARITAEPQYADLRFVRSPRAAPRAADDVLTQHLAPRTLFEFAHDPPDAATAVSWTVKRDAWFLSLLREARRRKRPPPELPRLIALSAYDPAEMRRAYGMDTPTSPGVYVGAPSGSFVLLVLNKLPKTPQTLLARSMGRGRTLIDAIQEIEALPPKDKLRTLLWPRIETLRVALEDDPSPEAQEIVMNAEKIYNQRLAQQRKEGRKEGVEQTLRDAITTVCLARGLKLTSAQREKLAAQHTPATLRRWHARAIIAADASEIFGAG